MDKSHIRKLKSHYLSRWSVLSHNRKNTDKILLIPDTFVVKNLTEGTTLCLDCLGQVYDDIIPNLHLDPIGRHDNLVLINNLSFKYKTLDELSSHIMALSDKHLLPKGKLIFSFEHKFLIYDRINSSVASMLESFVSKFNNFALDKSVNLLSRSNSGYGDYFFSMVKL